MSKRSESPELAIVRAAFTQLGWNMTPVHILEARIERLEEALERYWAGDEDALLELRGAGV